MNGWKISVKTICYTIAKLKRSIVCQIVISEIIRWEWMLWVAVGKTFVDYRNWTYRYVWVRWYAGKLQVVVRLSALCGNYCAGKTWRRITTAWGYFVFAIRNCKIVLDTKTLRQDNKDIFVGFVDNVKLHIQPFSPKVVQEFQIIIFWHKITFVRFHIFGIVQCYNLKKCWFTRYKQQCEQCNARYSFCNTFEFHNYHDFFFCCKAKKIWRYIAY